MSKVNLAKGKSHQQLHFKAKIRPGCRFRHHSLIGAISMFSRQFPECHPTLQVVILEWNITQLWCKVFFCRVSSQQILTQRSKVVMCCFRSVWAVLPKASGWLRMNGLICIPKIKFTKQRKNERIKSVKVRSTYVQTSRLTIYIYMYNIYIYIIFKKKTSLEIIEVIGAFFLSISGNICKREETSAGRLRSQDVKATLLPHCGSLTWKDLSNVNPGLINPYRDH